MIAVLYMAPVITEFCNCFPGIELKLFENGSYLIREQVLQGDLDFGICICDNRNETKDQDLDELILFRDEMCMLVHKSNALSNEKSIRFSQLAHERFNLYNAGYALKDAIYSRCETRI
jgi:DNA-binding transcriptional LysR family regulator